MDISGWRYYNYAALPSTPPHEEVNTEPIRDGSIWKLDGLPLLARWTTNFDCGYETNWWYVIKDTPFDIAVLKAKRRYEINKGNKYFEVHEFDATKYVDEIYSIQMAAFERYPAKYRPTIDKVQLTEQIHRWSWYKVYGAFSKNDGTLCGYALLNRNTKYIYYAIQKVSPCSEPKGINAALVYRVLADHADFLQNGGYISDGARNIQHETAFQDYLEKYFGFRKAYCKLHITYKPHIKVLVKLLYPFRDILKRLDSNPTIHKINGVLQMECFVRGKKS